jgi:hypothetical protein
MSDEGKDNEHPEAASHEAPSLEPERAADAFKQGLGLLWKAARAAAGEIKHEVEKGGVSEALQQAGKELETAASHVGKALDDFVARATPGGAKPNYQEQWPPNPTAEQQAKQVDADVPEDGGTAEDGEKRDMRIQIDDD